MSSDVLSDRALNRATLARQLLLERSAMTPDVAVEHLVGLQAQNPLDPYLALWSRLQRLDPHEVVAMLEDRRLVRIVVMRGTIHLVTAARRRSCCVRSPNRCMDAELARHSQFAPVLVDVDLEPVMAYAAPAARRHAHGRNPAAGEPGRALPRPRRRGPRVRVPVPPAPGAGAAAGRVGQAAAGHLDAPRHLGRCSRCAAEPSLDDVAYRYLAAFGPATIADLTTWSRLTGLRAVMDRLRPRLRPFRDERGRELLDLPDAPRPDPDMPAPVRYLPEYDNLLLSHADRRRFAPPGDRGLAGATGPAKGTVLVDGHVQGIWRVETDKSSGAATAVVEHVAMPRRAQHAVEAEGRRALTVLAAGRDGTRRSPAADRLTDGQSRICWAR